MTAIHLGRQLPAASSDLPGSEADHPMLPYLVLLRVGFARPPRLRDAGALLPHHFTLTPEGAVCFCGTFRRLTPPGS